MVSRGGSTESPVDPVDRRGDPADERDRSVDRRSVLRAVGGGSMVALTGCLGDDGDDGDDGDPDAVDVEPDATWRTTALEDVTTGDEFVVADSDRPAIVHTFSRGCAACQVQQRRFDELYGRDVSVEIVELTIDPTVDPDDLRHYAADDGFDWRFGVSSEPVMESLVSDFGRDVTSAAASPVVVTCPDGRTYRLEKSVEADALEAAITNDC